MYSLIFIVVWCVPIYLHKPISLLGCFKINLSTLLCQFDYPNPAYISEFRDVFAIFDKKNTGMISISDFTRAIETLGLKANKEDISAMSIDIDVHGMYLKHTCD